MSTNRCLGSEQQICRSACKYESNEQRFDDTTMLPILQTGNKLSAFKWAAPCEDLSLLNAKAAQRLYFPLL